MSKGQRAFVSAKYVLKFSPSYYLLCEGRGAAHTDGRSVEAPNSFKRMSSDNALEKLSQL